MHYTNPVVISNFVDKWFPWWWQSTGRNNVRNNRLTPSSSHSNRTVLIIMVTPCINNIQHFNYKGYNSQVLIGRADSNYEFTSILVPMVVYPMGVS